MRLALDRKFAPWMLAGCGLAADTGLSTPTTGDYTLHGAVSGDNAGPAIGALAHVHLSAFLAHQPLMGLTSILLRLPLAAVAIAAHAGQLTVYRLGALACLLPVGLLAAWIGRTVQRPSASTNSLVAGILALLVIVSGPPTAQAVVFGHPEEVLASGLAVAAVLAAGAQRPRLAAVLLGLAVGTKQWALLATVPVLIAAKRDRTKLALLAGSIGLVLTAAIPLLDPTASGHTRDTVFGGHLTDPFSVWWPFGSVLSAPIAGTGTPVAHRLPLGLDRAGASAIALALALAPVAALAVRRRRWSGTPEALALLALLGLLRCISDPTPLEYNFVAVMIPLATWEVAGLKRVPVVAIAALGAVWLATEKLVGATPYLLSAFSLAGAFALAAYLTRRALGTCGEQPSMGLIITAQEPITGS